jgi:preprotein translocase subunit SecD
MAIDSNVLINERIREELRAGHSPQVAINKGYRACLGDDCRFQHHLVDCGHCFAGIWLWPSARFCRGALYRHFDLNVLIGGVFARLGKPVVWPSPRLKSVSIGSCVAPDAAPKTAVEKE